MLEVFEDSVESFAYESFQANNGQDQQHTDASDGKLQQWGVGIEGVVLNALTRTETFL